MDWIFAFYIVLLALLVYTLILGKIARSGTIALIDSEKPKLEIPKSKSLGNLLISICIIIVIGMIIGRYAENQRIKNRPKGVFGRDEIWE